MRKISITEALVELKLYDKKINDAIAALRVLAVAGKKKKATDIEEIKKCIEQSGACMV